MGALVDAPDHLVEGLLGRLTSGETALELLAPLVVWAGWKVDDVTPCAPDRIPLHAALHETRLPHGS
jgi:hypothetical protein